jgi:hypothetical protein
MKSRQKFLKVFLLVIHSHLHSFGRAGTGSLHINLAITLVRQFTPLQWRTKVCGCGVTGSARVGLKLLLLLLTRSQKVGWGGRGARGTLDFIQGCQKVYCSQIKIERMINLF